MLVISFISFTFVNPAYGFVDGNNNGRDDVEEWQNSMDYRLSKSYQEGDKLDRHKQCDIFNGNWNDTAGGSCKYMQGNNTCTIPTNGPPRCGDDIKQPEINETDVRLINKLLDGLLYEVLNNTLVTK